jgi:flagella basal body P-ring formation protein FlgA
MMPMMFLLAAALSGPPLSGGAALQQAAQAETGLPLLVDPRLAVPDCPEPFRFEPRGAPALRASCPSTGWSILIPVAGRAAATPTSAMLVRRGDPVRVRAGGPGFEVRIDGVATGAGGPGDRVRVKLAQGGHVVGEVTAEGELRLAGRP